MSKKSEAWPKYSACKVLTVFALATVGCTCLAHDPDQAGQPVLWRRVEVPDSLLAPENFAGDIRMGELDGDGAPDFVVFRSTDKAMKPCFLGAFDLDGRELWKYGEKGDQPARPGPVTLYDFDGDGADEVLCFFIEDAKKGDPRSMENILLQLRRGDTGAVLRQASPMQIRNCSGEGANWVHHRLFIANFRGNARPQDFVVKLGSRILAFTDLFAHLWTYEIKWNEYGRCSAYIPAIGDIDGDGKDEVNGGYYLLDNDGRELWAKQLAPNMDSVAIARWDNDKVRAICSGGGHILDEKGNVILRLGEQLVPHGQEARVADFDHDRPGPEMIIRYNGHSPDVMVVANDGHVLRHFRLNDSPNNTGMEAIMWNGSDAPALLYNGGALWTGDGKLFANLPGLPKPKGPAKMGWYHCIPADLCGDSREELVIYNPWDKYVWIYAAYTVGQSAAKSYLPTSRQYNVRLMD